MAVGKPKFDARPGVLAGITARIWICSIICISQYWLLTASMEAHHAGNHGVALPMFLASLLCFLLVAGLIVTGENTARRAGERRAKE